MKILTRKNVPKRIKGGYALIFSVLTASILLSAGLGIANIVYKQLIIAAIGRQSVAAFYAADTGAECAIHWNRGSGSGGSIFVANNTETSRQSSANCAGVNLGSTGVEWNDSASTATNGKTTFKLPTPGNGCAFVTVRKTGSITDIESRGFNTACDVLDNSRRVERALRFRVVPPPPPPAPPVPPGGGPPGP